MVWQILLAVSIVSSAIAVVFRRLLMKGDDSDPYAYSIAFQLVVSLLIFIFTLFVGFKLPSNLERYTPNLIIMVVLYTIANVSIFKAFKAAEAGTVRILYNTRAIWILLGSVLLLKEEFTLPRFFGTLLIILATFVLSFKNSLTIKKEGLVFALSAGLFYGLAFVNDAFLAKGWDIPSLMAVEFLLVPVFMAFMRPKKLLKMKALIKRKTILNMLIGGFFYGLLSITTFLAYQKGGDASVIGPIGQTSAILVVIFGALFLGENKDLSRKFAAAVLSVAGVILLL